MLCMMLCLSQYLIGLPSAEGLSSGVAAASVLGPRGLPGPLMAGAIVVEQPAILVLVGLPVT